MTIQKLMTSEQVANYLNVSTRTLQRKRDAGKIRFIQDGSLIRYRYSDVEHYLNSYIMETIDQGMEGLRND